MTIGWMVRCSSFLALCLVIPTGAARAAPGNDDLELVGHGALQPSEHAPGAAAPDEDRDDREAPRAARRPLPPMPPSHGDPDPHKPDPDTDPGKHQPPSETADKPRARLIDPKIVLGHDPQLAVGLRYVVAIEAHSLVFLDKKTGAQLASKAPAGCGPKQTTGKCKPISTRISTHEFFGMFLDPPPTGAPTQDVNFKIENASNTSKKLGCDPRDPSKLGGCVNEAYDARVLYDGARRRFWIMAALRNQVQSGDGCDPTKTTCVSDDSPLKQRFQAIAVSNTDDPRDGFASAVFHIRRPGDWPRIGVHHNYFVLGSNGSTEVHLLNANELLKENPDFQHISFGTFHGSDLGDPDYVYPVIQHDQRDESDPEAKPSIPMSPHGESRDVPTFLVAFKGSELTVSAFEDVATSHPSGQPQLRPALRSASIDLGHDTPVLLSPPVYRDGRIYMTGRECVDGSDRTCRQTARVIIVPVARAGASIVVSKSIAKGFADFTLGGTYGPGGSYEIPAIEVNKDHDVAIVYARSEPGSVTGKPTAFAPGAYYSIFLHDETGHHDGVLHAALCHPNRVSCALENPDSAGLDVAGIAVDPSDGTTFWMSHGYAAGEDTDKPGVPGRYHMIVGAVTARTTGYTKAHPTRAP